MDFNYYQILGISTTASPEEIKIAYRKLAKKHHPDKNPGNAFHEEHFKKINTAYQTLSDNTKKNIYDYKLIYGSPKKQPIKRNNPNTPPPPSSFRPHKKKPGKKNEIKLYIMVALGFSIIGVLGTYFYNFMNAYTAEKHYKNGLLYESKKQILVALGFYSDAIEFTNHADAYERRGQIRITYLKDYNGALYDLTQAVIYAEKPSAELFFQRAKCNTILKNYDAAFADLQSANKADPGYDSIYFYMAEMNNYIFKKHDIAIVDYNRTISINFNFSDAWFGKGIANLHLEDFKSAVADFNYAIEMKPNSGDFYYYRAYAKLNQKDTTAACIDFKLAFENNFLEAEEVKKAYCE